MNTSQTKAAEFNSINAGAPVAYNVNSPCVYTPNTSPVYIATVGKDSYLASPAVKRTLLIVAILQILSGLVGLAFGVISVYLIYSSDLIPIGEGVWCSIWVVIAGTIGCIGGCRQHLTPGIASTYLAFSIVSTVFMLLWIILLIVFAGVTSMILVPITSLLLGICGSVFIGCVRN